jgi:hypothetical protein
LKIIIEGLRNAEVIEAKDESDVVLKLTEMDGSYYGRVSEIKISAESYELLQEAIVENWLKNKKESI